MEVGRAFGRQVQRQVFAVFDDALVDALAGGIDRAVEIDDIAQAERRQRRPVRLRAQADLLHVTSFMRPPPFP